jgi:beta-xylosidase
MNMAYAWQADNGNGMFNNPVLYADYPDPDIIRVTNDFYMVSTTFADSPGINVLHSKDLVNWEIVGHCCTNLDWSPLYNMVGGTAYRQGFWASSIRQYNGTFYVVANPVGANARMYYATNAAGPWQYYELNQGLYDPGFLIDTNGAGYIFYGYSPQQSVAVLNANFSQIVSVSNSVVLSGGEGSHALRVGNYYYLFNANPGVWPYQLLCSRATNIFGPWQTNHVCLTELTGGHQGAIVDLDNSGTNYYGFVMQDGGAIGRMTYICPIFWTNGWPVWGTNGAGVPAVATKPVLGQTIMQPATSDDFTNTTLGLQWQWNHNPDNTNWSLTARPGYLRLMPTQATNFWVARNTLTQKGQGPWSRGEISLDVSHLQPGDICGFGTLGMTNGQIAVNCDHYGNKYLSMNVIVPTTNSPGLSVSQTSYGWVPVPGTNVYLRVALDFNANSGTCSYSFDDTNWATLGGQFNLAYDISVSTFQGEKYAIFCYNANASTGYVDVDYFHFTANIQRGRPYLNATRTTFVADDGQPLRGPFTSTEWTPATSGQNIAAIKSLGFNAVHLYAEDFDPNYPAEGSTAPGYSMANVDAIVAETATNGLYLIITIGNGGNNGDYNLAWATNFWSIYAPRYANQTHVLYEVHNEPVAWGPPYSATNATPPGAMNLETDCYNIIRANAPNTPVLLFTYAVFGGTGGTSAALTDIHAFNTAVFGNANAVWTNAAVAFHGYAGWQQTAIAASNLLSAGYPGVMTEELGTLWGSASGVLDAQLISQLEHLGISWITFEYIPPTGVSVDVTQPQNYSDIVNWAGLSWNPDYGDFPPARGTYGNGGLPWTTLDFADNVLAGTLHIEAENFDTGGQGVAYSVTNTANSTVYRTNEAVALEPTLDTGGGYDVTGTAAGEWLEYTIWVSEPGLYNLNLRVAGAGGSVQFLVGGINGTNLTGAWTIPATGGAQTWTTITNTVFLTPGQQVLHLNILSGGFNLNWLALSPVSSGLVANGTYKFLNQSSALALQGVVSSGNLAAGSDLGSPLQQWNLQHIGGNLYKITSVSNGWSWSANGDGNPMGFVWWWGAGGNECFYLQPTDSGYYCFLPVQDGLSIESALTNSAVVDEAVCSGGANQQWGVVATNAPDFPTGLTVTQVSATQINLTWNAVSGATSYNVRRATSSGGPYTVIATGITTTNYSDTSVVSGMLYYYVVSAVVGGAESLNSASAGTPLPYPWQTQDIGAVGVAGSAAYSNGMFTATGSGADIWNTADAFRYIYTTVSGNCTITAQVVSVQNVDPWTKAGVMIRSSLASNAPNAFVAVTPGNGVTWQYRSTTNGASYNVNTTGLSAPYWVSLVRSNGAFSGYCSPDGTNWTQMGTAQTITMGSTVDIGLALTSHNNSSLATATFDNVTAPNWQAVSPPATPTGLVATAISTNQISLTWNAFTNAASYNVKRSLTNGGPYTVIASGVTATDYADAGLSAGTTYYYVVSAVNTNGESLNSAQASATTPPLLNLLGHWLAGAANFRETSGYAPAGTFDGFAVASGSHYFTNDVPPNVTGVSLYLNNSGIGISNTCMAWDSHYTSAFDNNITNSFTVMCWAKGWPGGWNPWVSKFGESESGWQLRTDGSDSIYPCWTIRNNGVGTVTLGVAVYGNPDDMASRSIAIGNDGKWHHYAGTFDAGLGVRCLYVDGVLAASETGNTPCIIAATNRLMLGAKDSGSSTASSGGYGNYFTGNLYDVRIYNSAVSQTQIRSIAALTPPSPTSQFVGGNQLVVTWTWGTLLEATNLLGPWTAVQAASPYTNSLTAPQQFFRVSNP